MSDDNPFRAPAPVSSTVEISQDRERLKRIASAQRHVNIAVLLYLGLIPVNVALNVAGEAAPWIGLFLLPYLLLVFVLGAVSIFRLAAAFRGNGVAIIYVICMIIPCVGLLLLLSLSSMATKELRAAGVKVGLLGADPSNL